MKAVILAGGLGTRLAEETSARPKPMVEIGGRPVLWHIMKIYSVYGIHDFIVCCGYKGYMIKEYFANYLLHMSDLRFEIQQNKMNVLNCGAEPWTITLIDTGEKTMTGGRLKRVAEFLEDETFCLTYGDGVADVNVTQSIEFHKKQKTLATMTAVQPPGRFGAFTLPFGETRVQAFWEKPQGDGAWVNGGFFVLEPGVLNYITGDSSVWEGEPLQNLAKDGELSAFKHYGFWQPMDTLQDKNNLEEFWVSGKPPWKIWTD